MTDTIRTRGHSSRWRGKPARDRMHQGIRSTATLIILGIGAVMLLWLRMVFW